MLECISTRSGIFIDTVLCIINSPWNVGMNRILIVSSRQWRSEVASSVHWYQLHLNTYLWVMSANLWIQQLLPLDYSGVTCGFFENWGPSSNLEFDLLALSDISQRAKNEKIMQWLKSGVIIWLFNYINGIWGCRGSYCRLANH